MKQDSNIKGLKQRLREAESIEELSDLLREGEGYRFSNPATQRKWQRAAKERRAELKGRA